MMLGSLCSNLLSGRSGGASMLALSCCNLLWQQLPVNVLAVVRQKGGESDPIQEVDVRFWRFGFSGRP